MSASRLPYSVRTATGTRIDAEFPLHPDTGSALDVHALVDAVLATLDREIGLRGGATSNGDVLQAVAMALAVRAAMIEAPRPVTDRLARELLDSALSALDEARFEQAPHGNA